MSKKSNRILAMLNDPRYRNRLVGEINLLDQDEPAQVNRDQEIKVLKEMNEMVDRTQGTPDLRVEGDSKV